MIVEQRINEMIVELREAARKALAETNAARRTVLANRALTAATAVIDERDKLAAKLKAGMFLELENEASTDRWLLWERCFRALSNALEDAKAVLA